MKDEPNVPVPPIASVNTYSAVNSPIKSEPLTASIPDEEQLERERKEILRRYRLVLRKVRPVLKNPKEDIKRIRAAFEMAEEAHRGERRKSGEPYIYHPLEVARIVVEDMGLGATSVICAFLHDVVEDTNITLEDIRRKFGEKEANIIDGLTKFKAILPDESTNEQIETFRKVLLNLSKDIRVVLIKIADRLHNMRTLDSMSRENQLRTISETEQLYAPLAHRLGLYEIKSELEDLCLKYKSPQIYNEIVSKIKRTQPARDKFVKDFIEPIERKLRERGLKFVIKSRVKAVSSIYNKMQKQKIPFEDVYDLFAIRIILDSPPETEISDCWFTYAIVTDFYRANPERMRNWIGNPRPNGYESLHITVMSHTGQWVEVQIRSKRMDEIAEKGVAAHWRYKEKVIASSNNPKSSNGLWEEWLGRIREILENRDLNGLDMISEIYKELHEEEVYVFTPKGEMKVLRKGSTVLDFAFLIHTEVGIHCLAAKVNGRLESIKYVLKNGDKVEIIKSSLPNVSPDWLQIANNKRTQSKISQYLNSKRNIFVNKGREILQRKLAQMDIAVPQTEEFRLKLAKKFGQTSFTELEEKIGKEEVQHNRLKEAIREVLEEIKEKPLVPNTETSIRILKPRTTKQKLLIGGQSGDILYTLAKCCSPVKGEEVVGYMTVSRRLMVHRVDCPNIIAQMAKNNNKVIPLEWIDDELPAKAHPKNKTSSENAPSEKVVAPMPAPIQYEAALIMSGIDRDGIVNTVTQIISTHKVSMRSIHMGESDGLFEGEIVVRVQNIEQLENLIKELKTIEGIQDVRRRVL